MFDGIDDWDALVEDVLLEMLELVLVGLGSQAFVFVEVDVVWEDGVDAMVHVGLIVKLVRSNINRFELGRVSRRKDDLMWVALVVPLDLSEHSDIRKIDFVKDDYVIS